MISEAARGLAALPKVEGSTWMRRGWPPQTFPRPSSSLRPAGFDSRLRGGILVPTGDEFHVVNSVSEWCGWSEADKICYVFTRYFLLLGVDGARLGWFSRYRACGYGKTDSDDSGGFLWAEL